MSEETARLERGRGEERGRKQLRERGERERREGGG